MQVVMVDDDCFVAAVFCQMHGRILMSFSLSR